ncbi:glutathione S-transferase family protein [Endozoicomonas sp. OPT23]|uniref:glutathione S-transferase family protein n=1 Tax=Endozoicomonas sp. OPT23 TaxID=2072845 RepID=UPI00129BEC84|nr:glutathione S-transferase family protein [Endozoicomonas sp. OPT23]MRI33890.1 glutathione S-transferase family protein [Endozoicomonas sp. OPT23]
MIKIHHLKQSRSTRIIWLAEELGLDYDVISYDRDENTRLAPVSLREVHPLGKAPIVEVNGSTLVESAAILEYILDHFAPEKLRPAKTEKAYSQYLQWLHFAEGSAMLPVLLNMFLAAVDSKDAPVFGYARKEAELDFAYINETLADSDYFCGDLFTAADIMMGSVLAFAQPQGLLDNYPAILAYLTRLHQRPAFIKAASFG